MQHTSSVSVPIRRQGGDAPPPAPPPSSFVSSAPPSRASGRSRFSFDTAAAWVLVVGMALALVLFFPGNDALRAYTKTFLVAFVFLLGLVLFILARLTRGNVIVPPLPLLGALWLVPLAYALSALFSGVNPSAAFFGIAFETDTFGFMLLLFALATLTALVFRRIPHYKVFWGVFGGALLLMLLAQVVITILAKVAPGLVTAVTNVVGLYADFGMLAGLTVVIGLIAVRFLVLSPRMRLLVGAGIVLGLIALALTNIALLWVLTALVSLGLFVESIMKRRTVTDEEELEGVSTLPAEREESGGASPYALAAPLGVLVVSIFFLIGGSTIGQSLTTFMGTNIIDARPSWQATFDVGSHTYAASPLFGSGPGTFGEQWLLFRDSDVNSTIFWNVDFTSGIGVIPTSFVSTGIFGALAWLLFLGLFLFLGIRALLFRPSSDPYMRFVSVTSFTGTVYVLALSIFSVPGPLVLVLGFLLLGIFVSSLRFGATRQEWGILFAKSPRVGFVIVFFFTLLLLASVVATYGVVLRYLAQTSYIEAATAVAAGDFAKGEQQVNQSIAFAPSDRAYRLLSSIGVGRMNQIATDSSLAPSSAAEQFQAALNGSVQAALAGTELGPDNYQNWSMLGSVYQTVVPLNIEGAYENAKAAYERAVALNPTNPVLPFVVAQLEITRGNATAAEAKLIEAITLKRDYTQAIFLLSQLQVGQGKAQEALQAAEAAAYFAPNDPTVLFQVGILRSANGDTNGALLALARAVELNPQYANARFFLGVMYAIVGDLARAIAELETVAALSEENAAAIADDLAELKEGRNPFPPSRLGALGIPQPAVSDEADAPAQ